MIKDLNFAQRNEFSNILEGMAMNLDITKTQYENLVKSYNAVGEYLQDDVHLAAYNPIITPQGSLRLGTIIQPINEEDDLDVDLVFRLVGKDPRWTQKDLKEKVGHRLLNHGIYSTMLDEEGRRCWTLLYRKDSEKEKYHMDILPCIADKMYITRLNQMSLGAYSAQDVQKLNIRITDMQSPNYVYDSNPENWLKSNPDGYALWFASRCRTNIETRENIMMSIMPVGKYTANKSVLQKVVQLLKRHRDIMFKNEKEDKPISIIITTLAAYAYKGQTDLLDAYYDIVNDMNNHIQKDKYGNYVISNPVNPEENFADKWPEHPKRKENFFKWLKALQESINKITKSHKIEARELLALSFGKKLTDKTFNDLVEKHKEDVSNNKMKVTATGVLGSIGKTVKASNSFYGKK